MHCPAEHRSDRRLRRTLATRQIRAAAQVLGITEQGLRSRLLTLEQRLGVELYRKSRGPRRSTVLTDQGRRFLPHALGFLERAHELCHTFDIDTGAQEIRVAASQYLIRYVLIDVLKDFRKQRRTFTCASAR